MSELDNKIKKILEYKIPTRVIPKDVVEELNIGKEGYRLGNILEETDIYFPPNSDKPSIKTVSLEKVWEKLNFGANRIEVTRVSEREAYAKAQVELENGKVFEAYGEVNPGNANEGHMMNLIVTTENRAKKRALLKAIGLYPYLSEVDEEDKKLYNAQREIEVAKKAEEKIALKQKEFDDKLEQLKKEYEQKLKEKDEKYEQEKKEYEKTKEKNVALIKKLYDYVSLPKDDEKYPSEKIKEIEDKEYIMKLQKHSDQIIKVVAANFFREMKKKEMGIEEDSKKNKNSTGLIGKIKKEATNDKKKQDKTKKVEQELLPLEDIPVKKTEPKEEVKNTENKSNDNPFPDVDDFMKEELEKIKKEKKD